MKTVENDNNKFKIPLISDSTPDVSNKTLVSFKQRLPSSQQHRSGDLYNLLSEFRVSSGVSSQLSIPGKPPKECAQEAY